MQLTPEERIKKCGEMISQALTECECGMFTALKVGNAEIPLIEIAGFPIVVKVAPQAEKNGDSET
jgi:hypothetical protein